VYPHSQYAYYFSRNHLAPECLAAAPGDLAPNAGSPGDDADHSAWLAPTLSFGSDCFAFGKVMLEVALGRALGGGRLSDWRAEAWWGELPGALREVVEGLCAEEVGARASVSMALGMSFATPPFDVPASSFATGGDGEGEPGASASAVQKQEEGRKAVALVGEDGSPRQPQRGSPLEPATSVGAPNTPVINTSGRRASTAAAAAAAAMSEGGQFGGSSEDSSMGSSDGPGAAGGVPRFSEVTAPASALQAPVVAALRTEAVQAVEEDREQAQGAAKRSVWQRGLHRCCKRGRELRTAVRGLFTPCFGGAQLPVC